MSNPLTPGNTGDYLVGRFYPYKCNISAISQGMTTTVTTDVDHMFSVGNQVGFRIPKQWGIPQLNGMTGYISSILSTTEVVVNVNTIGFDPFVTPTPGPYVVIDYPEILPIGDSNTGYSSPGGVPPQTQFVPGAFSVTLQPELTYEE